MSSYIHFTHDERICLQRFLSEGKSFREIASLCGTNENTNDILRFFFPQSYDFRKLSQAQLDMIVYLSNNRPRKCLGGNFLKKFM